LGLFIATFAWSAIAPLDYFIWALEIFPAVIGLVVIIVTYRKFQLSDFTYTMILLHCIILMIGGHYTYAEMPLFDWLQEQFDLARNYYDRIGHIAQGFFPAIVAREILLRLSPLQPGKWLFFIVTSICLAISAMYELLEWWIAIATGSAADAFLATQGDVWDTQWDMFLALLGAMAAQLVLAKHHDQAMRKLSQSHR
jgi:putative membrane protein